MPNSSSTRHYPRLLLLYTLLAILLTWPLASKIHTHVPGDGIDDPSLAWNLWWIKTRLVDQVNLDIFHVGWMFHPIQINLGFYTLTPLNGLLSIPLQTAFNLVIANNLLLLSSFVVGGFGVYLLAQQELRFTREPTGRVSRFTFHAALFAGIIYAFASSKFFYAALGQFNIASSQWIPFCALYTLRLARSTTYRAGIRNALLAGLFLTIQAWAELTYASFLIIFIGLAFFWSLGRRETGDGRQETHNPQHFALLGLLFLLGIAPFLWAMIPDLLREGDFFASGGGFADSYSADLFGYLLPTQLHPFWGSWVEQFAFDYDIGQQIFIGYTALLLAIVGAFYLLRQPATRRWGSFWLINTLLFWWLTLGPQLRWQGQSLPIPGPFELISHIPLFSGNRYPSRYSVMLMMGVAILAAVGLARLLSRWEAKDRRQETGDTKRKTGETREPLGRAAHGVPLGAQQENSTIRSRISYLVSPVSYLVSFVCITLFLVEHLSLPLPLSNFRVPAIYERLAAEPGDFALLELPTGWRNGAHVMGKSDLLIMMQQWYQTTHGKRRLGGNTSRNPPYKFQYYINAPLLGDLIALMNDTPPDDPPQQEIARVVAAELDTIIERNRPIAAEVLGFLGVRYVTVHVEKASPALLRFVDEVLPLTLIEEWRGPDWSDAPSTIRLYKVNQQPQPEQRLPLGTNLGNLYLAEGWSHLPTIDGNRFATRSCASLLLNLAGPGRLTIETAGPASNVRLRLNGSWLSPQSLTNQPTQLKTLITPRQVAAFPDRLRLCFDATTLPDTSLLQPLDQRGWAIGETGLFTSVRLLVHSAGLDVGNFAQIWIDGRLVLTGKRGYNLLALDAEGKMMATATFDTHTNAAESAALATWIAQWPVDTIVVGAVRDEASNQLMESAVIALQRLGLTTDLRERFRWSHAFIGVVGAEPGTVPESATLLQPATVHIGTPTEHPAMIGGVKSVQFDAE